MDITIVDRISAVLNPHPICNCNPVTISRDAVVSLFLLPYENN